MIKIAHRGNYKGKNSLKENTIEYIEEAISAGFDVEIDVWAINGEYFLGHDSPGEHINLSYLERPPIWVHAKNLDAYTSLFRNNNVHVFWHDKDEFTFTSKGIKWAYSGVITHDGIMVMPDYSLDLCYKIKSGLIKPLGVCSDNFNLFL